jgi:hypothetical protein
MARPLPGPPPIYNLSSTSRYPRPIGIDTPFTAEFTRQFRSKAKIHRSCGGLLHLVSTWQDEIRTIFGWI